MQKKLYVSDLDGTLLTKNQELSKYTESTINSLVDRGMIFSYATARSFFTAGIITKNLRGNIPVIVYNGTFILENGGGKKLHENYFKKSDAAFIKSVLEANGVFPIVYAFIGGEEKFSYIPNASTENFLNTRRGDGRDRPCKCKEDLLCGDIFHFSCIDKEENLFPAYEILKDKFPCVYNKDIYSGEQWLEVHPVGATKANAILKLKEILGCDSVVCFGDGENDVSMFRAADECYAVENAVKSLKSIASGIIESNENDGVAKWLAKNIKL